MRQAARPLGQHTVTRGMAQGVEILLPMVAGGVTPVQSLTFWNHTLELSKACLLPLIPYQLESNRRVRHPHIPHTHHVQQHLQRVCLTWERRCTLPMASPMTSIEATPNSMLVGMKGGLPAVNQTFRAGRVLQLRQGRDVTVRASRPTFSRRLRNQRLNIKLRLMTLVETSRGKISAVHPAGLHSRLPRNLTLRGQLLKE